MRVGGATGEASRFTTPGWGDPDRCMIGMLTLVYSCGDESDALTIRRDAWPAEKFDFIEVFDCD
jgi:hypothetical protein